MYKFRDFLFLIKFYQSIVITYNMRPVISKALVHKSMHMATYKLRVLVFYHSFVSKSI